MIPFEYQIKRSARRRTLSIRVLPDNRVVVTAPGSVSRREIAEVVESKAAWIERAFKANEERHRKTAGNRFETGRTLFYLGREFALRVESAPDCGVSLAGGTIRVRTNRPQGDPMREPDVRSGLVKWYTARALEQIEGRVRDFSQRIGVTPRKVTVKSMRSRWGSCSSHGNISLVWNIVMAPEEAIDYLIVHELCHMVHHNHSTAYWNLVRSFLPDFDLSRKWLRTKGFLLRL
ncbi:MAG: M48 family metallopeptidase [Desulfobacteraceae bacterium]|nr:M48 family metallopeptidase [Desulfobacteraceae bacterium]